MKHQFHPSEIKQWKLAGIPLDKLDDLYKPTIEYSIISNKSVTSAIQDITRIIIAFKLELPIKS